MAADIVLNNDSVEVVGGTLQVHDVLLGMGQDGGRWLRAELDTASSRTPTTTARVQVGSGTQDRASVQLSAKDGSTTVSSSGITTSTVTGRRSVASNLGEFGELSADEVNVGNSARFSEGAKPGVVSIASASGEATIVLDGASGDIMLSTIGSLVAKINDLQRQIDQLRR